MAHFNEFRIISETPVEALLPNGVRWARYLPGEIYRVTDVNHDFVNGMIEKGQAEPLDPDAPDSPMASGAVTASAAQATGSITMGPPPETGE